MNKTLLFAAFLAAAPAAAQAPVQLNHGLVAPQSADGSAMQALTSLADGSKTDAAAFDGTTPRREGPLTILSEEKNVLLDTRERPGYYEHYSGGYGYPGYGYPPYGGWGWGMGYGYGYSRYVPPATIKTYGTRQQVEITDRKGYVRQQTGRGAKRGGLFGAIFGVLIGLAAMSLGVGAAIALGGLAIGAIAGDHKGRRQPTNFTNDVAERTEVIYH